MSWNPFRFLAMLIRELQTVREPEPVPWRGWFFPVADTRDGRRALGSSLFEVGARSRTPPDGHMGVDIMGARRKKRGARRHPNLTPLFESPPGTHIVASGPGKVIRAGMIGNGLRIAIDHGFVHDLAADGRACGKTETLYLHCEKIFVAKGDTVVGGQVIALMGFNPFKRNTVRHLHHEVWLRRKRKRGSGRGTRGEVDPQFFYPQWGRKSAGGGESVADGTSPVSGSDGAGDVVSPAADDGPTISTLLG